MIENLRSIKKRTDAFEREVCQFLLQHEAPKPRVISLHDTRKRLACLSLAQDELFRQALLCVEHGAYRAAHVMSWAAFSDYLQQKLASDGLISVRAKRPAWSKYKNIEELRDEVPEYQMIEAARDVGLLSKSQMKTLHGLLSKRNECAHPSEYDPGLNESLGYVAELLNRIDQLRGKTL
jgi:hypothetical protein